MDATNRPKSSSSTPSKYRDMTTSCYFSSLTCNSGVAVLAEERKIIENDGWKVVACVVFLSVAVKR